MVNKSEKRPLYLLYISVSFWGRWFDVGGELSGVVNFSPVLQRWNTSFMDVNHCKQNAIVSSLRRQIDIHRPVGRSTLRIIVLRLKEQTFHSVHISDWLVNWVVIINIFFLKFNNNLRSDLNNTHKTKAHSYSKASIIMDKINLSLCEHISL